MKKIVFCILAMFVMLFSITKVNALDVASDKTNGIGNLVSVDSSISAKTKYFNYSDLKYDKSSGTISFGITNLSNEKLPVSISVGFFGIDNKNIGVFNYCSTNDIESNYSGMELVNGQGSIFSQQLGSKYFGSKYSSSDVAYISLLTDNKDCKIGGASNYIGKTVEQINNQESVATDKDYGMTLEEFVSKFTFGIIIGLIISLIFYIVYGFIINNLHTRVLGYGTGLCWVPICNSYLCVKLAFGKPIAIIYIVLAFIFSLLHWYTFGGILSSILIIAALILDIVKIITGNYNLCIVEHFNLPTNFGKSKSVGTEDVFDNVNRDNSMLNNNDNSLISDEVISTNDLNMNDSSTNNSSTISNNSNNGSFNNSFDDNFSDDNKSSDEVLSNLVNFTDGTNLVENDLNKSNTNNNNTNNNKDGNSDLANFFK